VLFRIAYGNNKHLDVYRLSCKAISRDIIDVNLGRVTLHVRRGIFIFKGKFYFKQVNYLVYHADKHAWTEVFHQY
jgi:hypothetical protein